MAIRLFAATVLLLTALSAAHARILKFVIVDARNGKELGTMENGQRLGAMDYITMKAVVDNPKETKTIDFVVNGKKIWTDYFKPYFITGNINAKPSNWKKPTGSVTIQAVQTTSGGSKFTFERRITVGNAAPNPPPPPPPPPPQAPSPSPSPKGKPVVGGVTNVSGKKGGSWKTVKTVKNPVARHEACFVMAGGKGYLIGGRGNKPTNIYDPVTRTWTTGAGAPFEMHHMQCVSTPEGDVWVPSAFTGGFPHEKNVARVWVYRTKLNKWESFPGMKASRRRGGAAAVRIGDWIYVIAGNRGGHGAHSTAYGWMDRFNYKTKKWEQLPTAPDARDHVGGGVVKGMICIAGGRDSGVAQFSNNVVTTTNCYNIASKKWLRLAPMPSGRAGAATDVDCFGRLVVAGGEGFGKAFKRVDYFNGNSWETPTMLNRARHGSGLAVSSCACGQITIASGSGNQGGGPELTSTETFFPGNQDRKCR